MGSATVDNQLGSPKWDIDSGPSEQQMRRLKRTFAKALHQKHKTDDAHFLEEGAVVEEGLNAEVNKLNLDVPNDFLDEFVRTNCWERPRDRALSDGDHGESSGAESDYGLSQEQLAKLRVAIR